MDRRSWLWRRKSSDKSAAGETESIGSGSGSLSSPSERFSDDHQAYSGNNVQSPEVTSKVAAQDEDASDVVKILTEKLSAALANVTVKEELAKQHAKVAEEAVEGWEKAEKEAATFKQQLDAATKKNLSLEDRVVHLDGALKECLRQLRQMKEEKDQKIQEATDKKSEDSEFKSSELDAQLADLRSQLETANAKLLDASSVESELCRKVELAKRENASLQLELHSQSEELQLRILERDLSTKTAETASKQHLESMRKVAKLEAECRRLKAMTRKVASFSDHRSLNDSKSDGGERTLARFSELDPLKVENPSKSPMSAPRVVSFMDDFLEMERLAASPVGENRSLTDEHDGSNEVALKSELDEMRKKTVELEETIQKLEAEKVQLNTAFTRKQDQLKHSEASLAKVKDQLNECQNQVKISQAQLADANNKLGMLQAELDLANELRQAIELELEDANVRKEDAESHLKPVEYEKEVHLSKIRFLEGEVEMQKSLHSEASVKCQILEEEVSKMKSQVSYWQSQLNSMNGSKESIEQEHNATCKKLEEEISRMRQEALTWKDQIALAKSSKEAAEREFKIANSRKDNIESQLKAAQAEAQTLLAKVGLLERQAEKERELSADFATKCKKLEDELSEVKHRAEIRVELASKEELKMQQEKELTVAASKFAECQKTIASLGKQLKSLATLDDLFFESDSLQEHENEPQLAQNIDKETAKVPSSKRVTVEKSRPLSSESFRVPSAEARESRKPVKDVKEGLSSLLSDKSQKNGFGKLFPRSKSAMRTRNTF